MENITVTELQEMKLVIDQLRQEIATLKEDLNKKIEDVWVYAEDVNSRCDNIECK